MNLHKVISSQNSENGSFLLDIPLNIVGIPGWLVTKANLENFKAKSEYHVTVIGLDLASKIKELGLNEKVRSLINSFEWSVSFTDTYIELAKSDENNIYRQSIIRMVKVPELNLFINKLEDLTGFTIDIPPTHITLYTKNYDRGIGLYSMDDLNQYKIKELSEKF